MRKSRKKLVLELVAAVAAVGLVLFGVSRVYSGRIDELKENLAQLTGRLNDYEEATGTVVCAATDIMAGDRIKAENLKVVEVSKSVTPEDAFMTAKDVTGIARIDILAGTYLTAGMLAESKPDDDIRELEFIGIYASDEIQAGCYVDVRLKYPDGTDYVVLAKKNVFSINSANESLTLHVSEEELLMMDSALVDAYLFEGAKLYATEYIERELQAAAKVNYVPSQQSIELIKNDPNIVKIASEYLLSPERERVEGRMAKDENY